MWISKRTLCQVGFINRAQPNQASAGDCAVTSCLTVERQERAAPDRQRSPERRAERAQLKSCKDDEIIAQKFSVLTSGLSYNYSPNCAPCFSRLHRENPRTVFELVGHVELGIVACFSLPHFPEDL